MDTRLTKYFDAMRIRSISPFSPTSLIDMADILSTGCANISKSSKPMSVILKIGFVGSESTFSIEEFKKYFSESERYTQVLILALFSDISATFHLSGNGISITLSSNTFTKAQLEKVMHVIYEKLTPYVESAKRTKAPADENDPIELLMAKVRSLPITDEAGNYIEDLQNINNDNTNSKNNFIEKPPFYKNGIFWGAASLVAGIAMWAIDRFIFEIF